MLKEDKWCMELCVSLNRFKMFDSKIDLHRNQKAIQCLKNNNILNLHTLGEGAGAGGAGGGAGVGGLAI